MSGALLPAIAGPTMAVGMTIVIVALALLAGGFALLFVMRNPPRRGDTPYCRRCEYNLTGLDLGATGAQCPECGVNLHGARAVVRGECRSTWPLGVGGVLLLLLACLTLAPLGQLMLGSETVRLLPATGGPATAALMGTLAFVALTLLVAGVALLCVMCNPPRHGDRPYCRHCEHNLTGLDLGAAEAHCPVCGANLRGARAVIRGECRSTWPLGAAGVALLLLACAALAPVLLHLVALR